MQQSERPHVIDYISRVLSKIGIVEFIDGKVAFKDLQRSSKNRFLGCFIVIQHSKVNE